MAQTILYLIVGFIVFEFVLSKTLSWLNLRSWDNPLPAEVKDLYDAKKYAEAKDYAFANFRSGMISSTFSLIITIAVLMLKGFAGADEIARNASSNHILQALVFFAIVGGISAIISLPFDIYDTFVVEEKFGFNKVTPGLFMADKLKGLALAVIVGGGLIALLTFLYGLLGDKFWIAAWVVVAGISI
ncbi:MAG: transrane metalloprotease, family, partial [Bacteroidota bacterium]|nr:transrane metalloprotease, family [Bacteroidota bacterium]